MSGKVISKVNSKRESVVEDIARVFRRHGYDGTTMSVISAETALGRSSIYHHFPAGKEEMALSALEAVAAHFDAEIYPALARAGSLQTRLRRMGRLLQAYYEDGTLGCLLGAFAVSDTTPQIRTAAAALFEDWVAAIADVHENAGGLKRTRARECAESYVIGVQGALVAVSLTGDRRHLLRALGQASRSDR